ncbi:MAG: hypothetical protein V6015_01315 [Candidatus Dasytiphilus stammeri]
MAADNSIRTLHEVKLISWNAIFAGLISTLVIEIILLILGTAVGASSIFPWNNNSLTNLSMGPIIWTSISMIIAIAIGSYLAGMIAMREGGLHGMLVWALKTLICFTLICIFLTQTISGAMNLLGTGLQAASKGASIIASHSSQLATKNLSEKTNINLDKLQSELLNIMHDYATSLTTNSGNPLLSSKSQSTILSSQQSIDYDIIQWLKSIIQTNQSHLQTEDYENFKKILKSHLKISDIQVEKLVKKVDELYYKWKNQISATAKKAAYKTANTISKISWFVFFVIIIEAIVAVTMAQLGYRKKKIFWNR